MKDKWKILKILLAVLALVYLAVFFVFSESIADHYKDPENTAEMKENEEMTDQDGKADLILSKEKRSYDGTGIFDPMEGVTATDCDGSDLSDQVAVAYASGNGIEYKILQYTVFDSKGNKHSAKAELQLEKYTGPDILCEMPEHVKWEELPELASLLANQNKLTGLDGFGNDITPSIACAYEMLEDQSAAVITFSLQNQFQDMKVVKFETKVDNIPQDVVY